jgi:hypothetical protein
MKPITIRAATALRKLRAESSGRRPQPRSDTQETLDELVKRVDHLEQALEGLQDAVYRQDVLHDSQIAALRPRRP